MHKKYQVHIICNIDPYHYYRRVCHMYLQLLYISAMHLRKYAHHQRSDVCCCNLVPVNIPIVFRVSLLIWGSRASNTILEILGRCITWHTPFAVLPIIKPFDYMIGCLGRTYNGWAIKCIFLIGYLSLDYLVVLFWKRCSLSKKFAMFLLIGLGRFVSQLWSYISIFPWIRSPNSKRYVYFLKVRPLLDNEGTLDIGS